jgi:hypothetical protein
MNSVGWLNTFAASAIVDKEHTSQHMQPHVTQLHVEAKIQQEQNLRQSRVNEMTKGAGLRLRRRKKREDQEKKRKKWEKETRKTSGTGESEEPRRIHVTV